MEKKLDPMAGFNDFVAQRGIEDLPYDEQLSQWRDFQMSGIKSASLPANIQVMNEMERRLGRPLTEEEMWTVVRNPAIIATGGGGQSALYGGGLKEVVSPEVATEREAAEAAATAEASAGGKARGEAIAAAPSELRSGQQALDVIDKMINHPGREAATGFSSIGNVMPIPGSDRADFLTLGNQLRGKVFLEAFQMLKGGGQITEIEGLKAEQAMARLNAAQSEGEYLQALEDLRQAISDGMAKLSARTGVTNPSAGGWSIKGK
jgi:hypothetical protein